MTDALLRRCRIVLGAPLRAAASGLAGYFRQNSLLLQKRQRRLRVSETVSLGEKRSLSIVEVDGQAFLIGSSGANIALLATLTLPDRLPFECVLEESLHRSEAR